MSNRSSIAARSALAIFLLAALLRVGHAGRQGLWADEFFSLALATGHSLEQPAAAADPAKGDFIESPTPLSPEAFGRYLDHDSPPAGAGRVIRAVLLSDTNPPLYYLLLNGWTRFLGTGDTALRLFTVAWSLACFPLLWSLARRVGGRPATIPTTILFALSPLSICYSTEGRMYSLLWFLALAQAWLTARLARGGARPAGIALWVATGIAGFLTHYFFAFVWVPCVAWILAGPGKAGRAAVLAGAAMTALAIFPWYRLVPASLASWRVTWDWLQGDLTWRQTLEAPFTLLWSFFSNRGKWGGSKATEPILLALFAGVTIALFRKLSWRAFGRSRGLVWLWLAATCIGVPAFDLLRHTFSSRIPRYALAGMPAGFLLAGLALGRLRPRIRLVVLSAILAGWMPGLWDLYRGISRDWEPYREVGETLALWARPSDLILMHSIPSGVIGLARYLKAETGMASWVGQLRQRQVPRDVETLIAGRRRVCLVNLHAVNEPAPEETWLRENAELYRQDRNQGARLFFFKPRRGDAFPMPREGAHPE